MVADDFEALRKHVLEESAENRSRLDEIHALSEQALDAHAMLSNGLQIVTTQSARTDEKIDALAKTVHDDVKALSASIGAVAQATGANRGDMRWVKGLLFLLLLEHIADRVLVTAPAKALFAMVTP